LPFAAVSGKFLSYHPAFAKKRVPAWKQPERKVIMEENGTENGEGKKSFSEQLFVSGKELVDTIKKLINEGNARALILWNEDGSKLLEIPLTGAVALGGAALILAPFMAIILGIAGWAKKIRIEVVPRQF
jgi:hypothetical protein